MICTDHGEQLVPNGGPWYPCGLCDASLYQQTLVNECPCGEVFGVIQTRKWVGDAWVIDEADSAVVRPVVEEHFKTCLQILGVEAMSFQANCRVTMPWMERRSPDYGMTVGVKPVDGIQVLGKVIGIRYINGKPGEIDVSFQIEVEEF